MKLHGILLIACAVMRHAFSHAAPMCHGAFTLSQAVQLFDLSKSSAPKRVPSVSLVHKVCPMMGVLRPTGGVLATCDEEDRVHLFVHKNSTILRCVWDREATAKDRSLIMADLRRWHAAAIEPVAGRVLDAQLYAMDDVRAWWGV